jgi:hypothetical protein
LKTLLTFLFLFFVFGDGQVFTPDKKFVYNVHYHQNEINITTNEIISLNITGKMWKVATEQKEAIWQYQTKSGTRHLFKDLYSLGWFLCDTTGIIENDKRIWLHPPRHNQYFLTEIAPFPDFRKKSKAGDQYSSITFIGSGFGPWDGKKVKSSYSITTIDKVREDSLWTIKAISEIEGKTNNCEFIFSKKSGFTSMSYLFFNGDSMTMKLEE